jgi:hypothetical protein
MSDTDLNCKKYSCYIYTITCNDCPEDIYVGHTIDFEKRKNKHYSVCNNPNSNGFNTKLYQTIRDNGGFDNWNMEIIYYYKDCKNRRDAEVMEQAFIEKLNANLNMVKSYITEEVRKEEIKKYQEENKEKINERHKKYYEENKEYLLEKAKEYVIIHNDKIRERRKKYWEENKEKISERHKKWYYENHEINLERNHEYYQNNKEKLKKQAYEYYNNNKDTLEYKEKSITRHKIYYENNKDQLLEKHLKRYYDKKDDIINYQKERYQKLKNEFINCEKCNSLVNKYDLNRHKKTLKCINNIVIS